MRVRIVWPLVAVLGLTACAPSPVISMEANRAKASAVPTVSSAAASPSVEPTPEVSHPASSSPAASATSATSSAAAATSCSTVAAEMTIEQRVGQLLMVAVSTSGLDESTRSAIAANQVGSVVLLGQSNASLQGVRELTAAIGSLGTAEVPMLISVDQEGGTVQRLKGEGFSDMPSARTQGSLSYEELTTEAATWAAELRKAGVHYNLAPVADVVPLDKRSSNAPIGKLKRDFGSDPQLVGESVTAFIKGMHESSIATAVKHFPGLGEVTANTDFDAATDTVTTAESDSLAAFRAAIAAGTDSVMISSAVFERIDPANEGVFSSAIMQDLLRDKLGFTGVVIADDLGAAVAVKDVSPAQRAVRFVAAGGDLLINANAGLTDDMASALIERAQSDQVFADQVEASATRVLELKASVAQAQCS